MMLLILAVVAGFVLGLKVGITYGHRAERRVLGKGGPARQIR
jgi:hypothetical protein